MTSPPTVAIIYGFSEGKWYGRKLHKLLTEQGYTVTNNVTDATVLIAHSAGCYMIPRNARARLVIHVGYTYWPGRSLLSSLNETLRHDYRQYGFVRWFGRCTMHDVHMLNLVQTTRCIPGWMHPDRKLSELGPMRHIFIRNQLDSYCHPDALLHKTNTSHTYVSLPGAHNDIWDNPEPYVNLLHWAYEDSPGPRQSQKYQ